MRYPLISWTIGCALMMFGAPAAPGLAAEMAHPHGSHVATTDVLPREPGQAAFAAVAEIVLLLEADPATDWSEVDLEGLRQHLIDMNELTLRAEPVESEIEGGLVVTVRGRGRTLGAVQRMVPAHALELDRIDGWAASATVTSDGARLTVTSEDGSEVDRIRGLGFIGLMATGAHHQAHHLAIARGMLVHGGDQEANR